MRTVDEQLQRILGHAPRLAPLDVPLLDSLGCVLAVDVIAKGPAGVDIQTSPAALGATDVVSDITAGNQAGAGGDAGNVTVAEPVLRVMTDADEAVPASHAADFSAATGRVGVAPAAGEVVATRGVVIGERQVAAIVAGGHSRARVHPRPRVVIIPVGNDLVEAGTALIAGQRHDVDGPMLTAAALLGGADAFRCAPAPEDPETLATIVEDQLVRADLIVVAAPIDVVAGQPTGSVLEALARIGNVEFAVAAMDPGPVVGFGMLGPDHVPVLVIPSDPSAALTAFEIFVRPLIRALAGRSDVFRPVVQASLVEPQSNPKQLRRYLPAVVDFGESGSAASRQRPLVRALPLTNTSALWMRDANALIVLTEDCGQLRSGDEVSVVRLDVG